MSNSLSSYASSGNQPPATFSGFLNSTPCSKDVLNAKMLTYHAKEKVFNALLAEVSLLFLGWLLQLAHLSLLYNRSVDLN